MGIKSQRLSASARRRKEIKATVATAMTALNQKKQIDWGRETPEITAAQGKLDGAMTDYVQDTLTREEVKAVYKEFVNLLEAK